jgi:transposase InsO family protein
LDCQLDTEAYVSRRGDCYDNAVIETFFATIKKEEAGTI